MNSERRRRPPVLSMSEQRTQNSSGPTPEIQLMQPSSIIFISYLVLSVQEKQQNRQLGNKTKELTTESVGGWMDQR
eukprot:scaffold161142_cov34-Cyclotella_meneghiniana.AAC.2